jgi:hypothetical protein
MVWYDSHNSSDLKVRNIFRVQFVHCIEAGFKKLTIFKMILKIAWDVQAIHKFSPPKIKHQCWSA